MIYWHVEKNSTCIYSQLKACSSSEIAAMIEGLLKHCTNMEIEKNFTDSHSHCLIITKRHFANFFEATEEEIKAIYKLLHEVKKCLIFNMSQQDII